MILIDRSFKLIFFAAQKPTEYFVRWEKNWQKDEK